MVALFLFVLVFLASYGNGRRLLRFFGFCSDSLEGFAFSVGLGYGLLGIIMMFLGFLSLFYVQVLLVVLLVFFLVAIPELGGLPVFFRGFKLGKGFFSVMLLVLSFFVLVNFISSFAPVSEFDSLSYHLAIPKIYLQHHAIVYIPFITQANWPQLVELLFVVPIAFNADVVCQLIVFSFSVLTAVLLYSFSRRYFSRNVSLFAVLVFYTLPLVSEVASQPMMDIVSAFYSLAALACVFSWLRNPERKMLVLAGVFAGLASVSKLYGLFFALALCTVIFYTRFVFGKDFRLFFSDALVFGLAFMVFVLPWLVKSYLYTGNPVWPYFFKVFGGRYWNAFLDLNFPPRLEGTVPYGFGKGVMAFLLLLWNTAMHETAFGNIVSIGPVFLAFLPLLLFFRKPFVVKLLLVTSLVFVVFWFVFTYQVFRYLFPVLPLLAIAVAYSIRRCLDYKILRFVVVFLLLSTLLFNTAFLLGVNLKKFPVVLNLESKDDYYASLKDWSNYAAFKFVNANLSQDAKLLLFREVRGYFSDSDYVWADPKSQGYIDYSSFNSSEDFINRVNELGITHVFINEGADIFKQPYHYDNRSLSFMDSLLHSGKLIYNGSGILIYELK